MKPLVERLREFSNDIRYDVTDCGDDDQFHNIGCTHQVWLQLCRDIDAAAALIESLEKDAKRYQYMKAHRGDWYAWAMRRHGTNNLDAAIDAAMAAKE